MMRTFDPDQADEVPQPRNYDAQPAIYKSNIFDTDKKQPDDFHELEKRKQKVIGTGQNTHFNIQQTDAQTGTTTV
jgi:hypothetical protein